MDAVTVGSGWQSWSPLSGTWWATKTNAAGTGGPSGSLPRATAPVTPLHLGCRSSAAFPDAKIYGRFLLKAGSNWNGFDGNADALTVGVNYAETSYDFEPDAITPTSNANRDSYRDGDGYSNADSDSYRYPNTDCDGDGDGYANPNSDGHGHRCTVHD